jgi:tRNA(fMet)-specific endonuclease VapC
MTYLLDTDHLTLLQTRTGPDFAMLSLTMSHHAPGEVGASVVSLHEQALGAHTLINSAKSQAALLRGYFHMLNVVESYRTLPSRPVRRHGSGGVR